VPDGQQKSNAPRREQGLVTRVEKGGVGKNPPAQLQAQALAVRAQERGGVGKNPPPAVPQAVALQAAAAQAAAAQAAAAQAAAAQAAAAQAVASQATPRRRGAGTGK
jgi:hypothetical protein